MALTSLQAPAKTYFILINIIQKKLARTANFLLYLFDTLTKDKSYNHPYNILHEIW